MDILKLFHDWNDVHEFGPGEVIFSEDEPAEVIYVVLAGEVDLALRGVSLGTEGQGAIIGEMAVIDAATRGATATALSKVRLARLDPKQYRALVRKSPAFSLHAMAALANRLRAVNRYIARLGP